MWPWRISVDIAEVLWNAVEIEAAIQAANAASGYSDLFLMITRHRQLKLRNFALGAIMTR